jgi:hypothetical protein
MQYTPLGRGCFVVVEHESSWVTLTGYIVHWDEARDLFAGSFALGDESHDSHVMRLVHMVHEEEEEEIYILHGVKTFFSRLRRVSFTCG